MYLRFELSRYAEEVMLDEPEAVRPRTLQFSSETRSPGPYGLRLTYPSYCALLLSLRALIPNASFKALGRISIPPRPGNPGRGDGGEGHLARRSTCCSKAPLSWKTWTRHQFLLMPLTPSPPITEVVRLLKRYEIRI